MNVTISHAIGSYLSSEHDGNELFRYRYSDPSEPCLAPRPLFHPIRTLAGREVSAWMPWDHPWHRGLSMTCADLSGSNFWGGPTFVLDRGYVALENHGRQEHRGWVEVAEPCRLVERLAWIGADGAELIDEERGIEIVELTETAWTMRLSFGLDNLTARPLEFGSPTTNGRPMAGYGGLFWRAPRSFYSGKVIAAEGEVGEAIMGKRSPYLAYVGRHDESGASSTMLFCDIPSNPRYPTQWFVRSGAEPFLSASFMFDEIFTLSPGVRATFTYLVSVIDGALESGAVASLANRLTETFGGSGR